MNSLFQSIGALHPRRPYPSLFGHGCPSCLSVLGPIRHVSASIALMMLGVVLEGGATAQPTRSLDTIPRDVTDTVREHLGDLYSADVNVRSGAAFALGKLGEEALPTLPFLAELLVDDELRWWHHKGDTPGEEAARALLALGKVSTPYLVDALQYPRARKWTVFALRRLRDPASGEGLLLLLDQETDPAILLQVVGALGEIGCTEATPVLVRVAQDSTSPELRAAAARALGGTGGEGAGPALVLLAEADPSVEVRRAAAVALGGIGGKRAIAALLGIIRADGESAVRRAALHSLGKLQATDATDELLRLLGDLEVQECAAWALGEVGDPRAASPLLHVAETAIRVGTRSQAVDSAGRLGLAATVAGLLGIAERDSSPFVRRRAVLSLLCCRPLPSAEALLRLLMKENDVTVQGTLVRALARTGGKRALRTVRDVMTSGEHWYVRKSAVDALAELPGEEAALRLAFRDAHPAVRAAAEQVLGEEIRRDTGGLAH